MILNAEISTIIFDFGGVIINLDLPLCISRLKKAGALNVDKYLSNYGQAGFFLQWERGEIDLIQFRNEIRKLSDLNPSDQEIDDAWCAFLQDIPEERIILIRELKKKYRILMLSNSNPLHIGVNAVREFALHGCTMQDLFDKTYISYELGMTKPNPAIFQYILDDLKIPAQTCLFLDDGEKNIQIASQLGFHTYLVEQGENLDFLWK